MTTTANINGVTAKDMTRLMHVEERIIAFYNKKYNFQIDQASAKEIAAYEASLKRWDHLKTKRDGLK